MDCFGEHNKYSGVVRFHYSCPESQGALLRQTPKFPTNIDRNKWSVADGYSDRISSWHPEAFEKASEYINGCWAEKLPSLTATELKEFARVLFDHSLPPDHVQVLYYFNVATGYDCPYIVALFSKITEAEVAQSKPLA